MKTRAADDISSWRGGTSNDSIQVHASNATIDAGAGDDVVSTYGHSTVDGGAGDDHIRTYDHSMVTGGAGNDFISAHDNAVVDAGSGDDTVTTYSHATVSAGDGDDHVWTNDHFVVDSGAGNDVVRIDNGSDSVDLSISGYSLNDVIVTQQYGRTIVNFKGSNDSLFFDHGSNGSARLSFADHTSVDIRV